MASDYSERVDPRRFYAVIKSPDSLVLEGSRPDSKLIERFADFLKSAGRANLLAEDGGIAQLVERLVRNEKARGSNPLTSNFRRSDRAKLAGARLRGSSLPEAWWPVAAVGEAASSPRSR